jgi:serine/threonine protein phosphatase PrpC
MSETHTTTITHAVEQMCKGQDYVSQGTGIDELTGENFQWTMLNDGHGTDKCINFLRALPQEKKNELIQSRTPVQALAEYIDRYANIPPNTQSGATVVIAKCYKNRFQCISSGDSKFIIFKDGNLVYSSTEHNCTNKEEVKRMVKLGYRIDDSQNIKMISEKSLTYAYSGYAVFGTGRRLACTQALGHNSMTGYNPEVYSFTIEPTSTYRVVLGSDGLYDVIQFENPNDITMLKTNTSKQICDRTVKRWLQEWEAHLPNKPIEKFKFNRDDCDDVAVSVVDIIPKPLDLNNLNQPFPN